MAFLLNLFFTVFEFVGGIFTNSIALISDGIHDLGDSLTIGLSLFFERKAKKRPDTAYTYGYRRYSLLGGLIAAVSLIVGSTIIIFEAVKRILAPEAIDTKLLLVFAIIGIVVNTLGALFAAKGHSANEKVISLHLFEDVAGWVVLLVGALIMYFFDITILDGILSILFTLFILYHVFKHLKEIIGVLMERSPEKPTIEKIVSVLKADPLVLDVHHIHHWSLEGETGLLTAHVVLDAAIDQEKLKEAQTKMHARLHEIGIRHATLEFEIGRECIQECDPE